MLSFQFVPQYGTLTLSLVFGSEDYNDLVNAGFPTDVFGVFVNGVNQALVPGTGLADLGIDASIAAARPRAPANGVGAQNCALYRDNPPFFDSIDSELDGYHRVLNLTMPVNAGQVNSISIGIADALDTVGDSAVLLAAGSVAAVPEPSTLDARCSPDSRPAPRRCGAGAVDAHDRDLEMIDQPPGDNTMERRSFLSGAAAAAAAALRRQGGGPSRRGRAAAPALAPGRRKLVTQLWSRHLQWVSTAAQADADPYGTGVKVGEALLAAGYAAVDLTVRRRRPRAAAAGRDATCRRC